MRFFRKRSGPASLNTRNDTVGLDHVRPVGATQAFRRRMLEFNHYDATHYLVESWRVWREDMRYRYKLGTSPHQRIERTTVWNAALRIDDDIDFNAVRAMYAEAGMAVHPRDDIDEEWEAFKP